MPDLVPAYETPLGATYQATVEDFLASPAAERYHGKVQLLFTSPPFPLNRKKRYGNLQGQAYVTWLANLAKSFSNLLTSSGSIVIELGNAWEHGTPTMSTLALEALLAFKRRGRLHLCQQLICHNPNRLPSPAQWVNVERSRLKDSHTHVWWLAKCARPKADNRRVLQPYSEAMKDLLKRQSYNSGVRPSEHNIGEESFLRDNGGAIPASVLSISNTRSNDPYLAHCRSNEIPHHPARMPLELAEFFIKFVTEPGDLVFDPFGGSNTTGAAAEKLGRKWLATEPDADFIRGSKGRFLILEEGPKPLRTSP